MAKFRSVLSGEKDPHLPEKEVTEYEDIENEKIARAVRQNELAMSGLCIYNGRFDEHDAFCMHGRVARRSGVFGSSRTHEEL